MLVHVRHIRAPILVSSLTLGPIDLATWEPLVLYRTTHRRGGVVGTSLRGPSVSLALSQSPVGGPVV